VGKVRLFIIPHLLLPTSSYRIMQTNIGCNFWAYFIGFFLEVTSWATSGTSNTSKHALKNDVTLGPEITIFFHWTIFNSI